MDAYQIARGILDELVAVLPATRGGAAAAAYLHPGPQMPAYGCGTTAWGLVTSLGDTTRFPQTSREVLRCGQAETVVAMLFGVDRCYRRPESNLALPADEVDSQLRDSLDDARALRQAVQCFAAAHGVLVIAGEWQPTRLSGDVFGGQLAVQALADPLCVADCSTFRSVDADSPMLPGDPRNE